MRKSILIGLALVSLGALTFASQTGYPGIYISDNENRWHIPGTNKASEEKLGYVICEGGYLGSPLIPNEKKIVDGFLQSCARTERIGPGKLPIIDAPASHNHKSSGYKAYKVFLSGRNYYLCHGFLNSTEWCSYEAEKQAMNLVTKIRKGEDIQVTASLPSTQAEEMPSQIISKEIIQSENLPASVSKQAIVEEVTREIAQTLQPPIGSSAPTEKKAIRITKEEMQALQKGEISFEQLASNRPIVSVNPNNLTTLPSEGEVKALQAKQIPLEQFINAHDKGPIIKTIAITANELEAVKSGNLNLQDLLNRPNANLASLQAPSESGQFSVKTLSLNGDTNFNNLNLQELIAKAQPLSLSSPNNAQPIVPMPAQTSQLPIEVQQLLASRGLVAQPIANAGNVQISQIPSEAAQIVTSNVQVQQLPPAVQSILSANGFNQTIPIQASAMPIQGQNQIISMPQTANMPQVQMVAMPVQVQAIPLQSQLIYQTPNQPQNYYYSQAVPTTQVYSTIYGTHTNTVYWPGMPRRTWY